MATGLPAALARCSSSHASQFLARPGSPTSGRASPASAAPETRAPLRSVSPTGLYRLAEVFPGGGREGVGGVRVHVVRVCVRVHRILAQPSTRPSHTAPPPQAGCPARNVCQSSRPREDNEAVAGPPPEAGAC